MTTVARLLMTTVTMATNNHSNKQSLNPFLGVFFQGMELGQTVISLEHEGARSWFVASLGNMGQTTRACLD